MGPFDMVPGDHKSGQEFRPLSLPTAWFGWQRKCLTHCQYDGEAVAALQITSPFPERLNNAQHLLLTSGIIGFSKGKFVGVECHRSALLEEDSSTTCEGGIRNDFIGQIRIGVSKYQRRDQCLLDGSKSISTCKCPCKWCALFN